MVFTHGDFSSHAASEGEAFQMQLMPETFEHSWWLGGSYSTSAQTRTRKVSRELLLA